MAITTLWDDQAVLASSYTINANENVDLLTSASISNTADNSLKITINYESLLPAAVLGSFYIGAIVEQQEARGAWTSSPLYQFSPLRKSDQAMSRVLVMQPDLDTFSIGVDDSIQPTNKEVCRISRVQGALQKRPFRVVIKLVDTDPTGPNAFVSFTVSAEADQYSV